MNRITHIPGISDLQIPDREPTEGLLLDRDRLVRMLRNELYDLHNERRRQEGTSGHAEIVQRIRYFDAILGWIQGQPAELVLIGRRRTT